MKWNSKKKLLLFSLVRHLNRKSRAWLCSNFLYRKKNLKKEKENENKSQRCKLFDNASAEGSLTALCNDFVPTSDFIMRKFVRKHRRTADYIPTHTGEREREIDIRMLYDNAGKCSLSCSLPRCGNYFFLCENKWNLHDTWVILHVNCFFWQTTQANTQDQPRGREGGKQTEMVAIVVFSVFTSVQQCQGESLVRVEHSGSSFWQLLRLLLLLLLLAAAALFTTQIAAGFTQAETNFTFSVCV